MEKLITNFSQNTNKKSPRGEGVWLGVVRNVL
jgi:hypothetical protein